MNFLVEIFHTSIKLAGCWPHIGSLKMGFVVRATDKAGMGVGAGWGSVGGGATIITQLLSRCWITYYHCSDLLELGYYQSKSCECRANYLLSLSCLE